MLRADVGWRHRECVALKRALPWLRESPEHILLDGMRLLVVFTFMQADGVPNHHR